MTVRHAISESRGFDEIVGGSISCLNTRRYLGVDVERSNALTHHRQGCGVDGPTLMGFASIDDMENSLHRRASGVRRGRGKDDGFRGRRVVGSYRHFGGQ